MHEWLIRLRVATADGSGLARAIDYSLNRWPSLIRYAQTGNLPIDNNPVENAIRPIALGKNYPQSIIRQGSPLRAPPIRRSAYSDLHNFIDFRGT
jgi:hypothetical protein